MKKCMCWCLSIIEHWNLHVLVFINYWIEKCTVEHWNFSAMFRSTRTIIGQFYSERLKV